MTTPTTKRSEPDVPRFKPVGARESDPRIQSDDIFDEMGEEFLRAATSGGDAYAEDPEATPDEMGDPFPTDDRSAEGDEEEPETLRRGAELV